MSPSSTDPKIGLSKSKLLKGLQCPKHLYLHIHSPELETPPDAAQQAVMDEGTRFGILAQGIYPEGILISSTGAQAIADTLNAIRSGVQTLFEATFAYEGVLVRVDILKRNPDGESWDLIEVKSASSVKREYLDDAAIQVWVLEGAGLKVATASVMVVNSSCVHPRLEGLFAVKDLSQEIRERISEIQPEISALKTALAMPAAPEIKIGPQCHSPRACGFVAHCWSHVPELSVFDLYRIPKERAWELYHLGAVEITDSRIGELHGIQARMLDAARSGKRWVDALAIQEELAAWEWPLHYLDFETIGPLVPRFPGTRPREQVPFQFSCHIQDRPGTSATQREFLHDDRSDPRPAIARALVEAIGPKGSIVAYNKGFEADCLRRLGEFCPEHAEALLGMAGRLVDPLPLIRRAVYDPKFHGSFSIKSVAPALLGDELDYSTLKVGNGQQAQAAFEEMVADTTDSSRKAELRESLLIYCRQDTWAMVKLVEWLKLVHEPVIGVEGPI